MIRFAVNACVYLVAAALGLVVAVLVLPDMSINVFAFLLDVVVFAVLQAVLSPFLLKTFARNAPAVVGAVGLISTFVALLLTKLVSNGLTISGADTWVFATLIIWIVSMVALLLLPVLVVRRILGGRFDDRRR